MSQIIELKVPDIGGHANVDVIEVFIKVGDTIAVDDSLITLETDKATMEVPAEVAGVVKEVRAINGGKISEGDVIALIEVSGSVAAPAAKAEAPVASAPVAAPLAAAPVAAPAAAAVSGPVEVCVPDIGGASDVDVIEVAVKAGDEIKVDDSLITLETDKATMEVPSTVAGRVLEVKIKVGDKVSQGHLILLVESAQAAVAAPVAAPAVAAAPAPVPVPAPAPVAAAAPAAPVVAAAPAAINEVAFSKAHAGPSVRKLARELGVDLGRVKGSGRKGRITDEDVKAFVKGVLSNPAALAPAAAPASLGGGLDLLPWPKVDFAKFGAVELKPLSRIKKLSGANLARNWVMIPHVTQFDEADITEMEAFRKGMGDELKAEGVKLTPLAFLIKAAVAALKKYPEFNASLDGDNLVLKQYFHIGFAADTPNGLVVPVIKDADKKSLLEIAQESGALAKKARDGKLLPTDMQGGCFSISSLGGIGGTAFTPIINAPEVAILGVSKSEIKPKWNGKEFAPRLMLPLSLSYDHRVIDGASAARFTAYMAQVLADIRRLML
ncbi:dihydrolipoyllysine-residue acetyltransferase [Craterilacuibacter sinensis]|uniref:Acetyltransferase component of pyruvate dehydrogenase complex n=1 Tax=Craterilacuibacter sinensis TaxID=2686017 RepID=A0A845BL72_9NEIS|nr:dihydrolipoyllysine-residue acetyltransferase [Craterilacuibacter sinensis]MXR36034.1 dihydrolipoyllysine-residue acetyltransferase [Craterilacuibacter sinensis]